MQEITIELEEIWQSTKQHFIINDYFRNDHRNAQEVFEIGSINIIVLSTEKFSKMTNILLRKLTSYLGITCLVILYI